MVLLGIHFLDELASPLSETIRHCSPGAIDSYDEQSRQRTEVLPDLTVR